MNLNPKFLIGILKQNGFVFVRAKGSHQIFHNDNTACLLLLNNDACKGKNN